MRGARIFIAIIAAVTVVFASPFARGQVPQAGQPVSVEELARQLEQTQQQLQQTQRQLDYLRQRDQQRETWEQSVVKRLPPVDPGYQPAGFGSLFEATEAAGGSECYPKCDKPVCQGMPHLCGLCLEKFSWNKNGGWKIVPFGMLRGEAIYAGQATTADAVIFFLNPTQPGIGDDSFTVHGKTSMLNFDITGPSIGSFQTGGMIVMNFLGPQPLRNTSGPNLLAAYGEVKNDCTRFAFGRMPDLFGPIAPNTVNMGQQRGAGNIGIYRGAIHLDRYFKYSDVHRWTLSGRISQQTVNDYLVVPTVRGKDNGWPNVETRIGVELGEMRGGVRPFEFGVSGLIGETQAVQDEALAGGIIQPALDDVSTTWGVCLDAQLQGKIFGARGEVWMGQAAGTYFMAALQSLNPDAQGTNIPRPIRSYGGWGELFMKPRDNWTFYVGFGIDDPNNNDIGFITVGNVPGQISLNQVAWATVKWDVSSFFELAFEVSHRKTQFIDPFNASDAMLYHFASSLKF
jgi:hypothetical protein